MARKVYIDVIVDDKGTTKRLAVDAKKLEESLGKVGKGSQEADRNLKGVAQISANATKNFSKMQQGISGGLVPAYATLAAQAFAVSAAFNFLQSAADFKNLTEGQAAFGAVTGVAYSRITKSLQEATDGQLKYAEAAQATAIGTAAGLTGQQLEGLATAAKNVSFALGRDLTDSFNRLIRGVTKAEPELLDELGIILRLDPATQQYAASIGKTKDELNAFERSQAVANFVLDEAEAKFGKIAKIIDEDAFAVQQFGKAFDDIVNQIKVGVVSGLGPVLTFLSSNINSLIAALGLFALPITKAIIPSLGNMSKAAEEASSAAKDALDKANDSLKDNSRALAVYTEGQEDALKKADKLSKAGGLTAGTKGGRKATDFLTGASDSALAQRNAERVLKAAERQLETSEKVKTGVLKGYNAKQVADLRASYKIRSQIVDGFVKRTLLSFKGLGLGLKVVQAQATVGWQKAFGGILAVGKFAAKGLDLAFKAASFVGIALLLLDIGKAAYRAFFPVSEESKEAQDKVEGLNNKLTETEKHLKAVAAMRSGAGGVFLTTRESVIQLGNALQEANIPSLIQEINNFSEIDPNTEGYEKTKKTLLGTTGALVQLNPAYEALNAAVEQGTVVNKDSVKGIIELTNKKIQGAQAAQQLAQSEKDVTNELNNLVNTIERAPLEGLVSALEKDLELKIKANIEESPTFQSKKAELEKEIARLEKTGTRRDKYIYDPTGTYVVAVEDEYVDRSKEDQEALDAANNNLASIKQQNEERLKGIGLTAKLLTITRNGQGEQLSLQKEISERKVEASEIDTVSQTFQARINRLTISELQAQDKIAAAKVQVVSAQTALKAAIEESNGEETKAVENARRAVEIAEDGVTVATNESLQLIEANGLREEAINLEKQTNDLKLSQLELTNRIAEAQRNLTATQTGVSTLGLTQGEAAAQARAQELLAIDARRVSAQKNLLDIQSRIQKYDIKAGEPGLTQLKQQEQAAINEIANLTLQERKLQLVKEIALNQLNLDTQSLRQRREAIALNPVEQQFNEKILEYKNQGIALTQKDIETIREQTEAQFFLNEAISAQNSINQSVTSGLQSGLEGIINGTKSVKEAFGDMAIGILQELSKVIARMLITRAIMAAFPGFGGAPLPTGTPVFARYGGVMEGYATGGIARGRNAGYPAILHGTEAVVPLPNGNSIPVEMRNGGGTGTNNVTVNVSVDQNGNAQTNTQMDNQQAGQLGKLISAAVQEELQRQKRPGGILSPYGAA